VLKTATGIESRLESAFGISPDAFALRLLGDALLSLPS
jgi:hypothetical protein